MTITTSTVNIESVKFSEFCRMFNDGKFGSQRFGQAFICHFNVDHFERLRSANLWEVQSQSEAMRIISNHVTFT